MHGRGMGRAHRGVLTKQHLLIKGCSSVRVPTCAQACAGVVHARRARSRDAHARRRARARGGAQQPHLARLQVRPCCLGLFSCNYYRVAG